MSEYRRSQIPGGIYFFTVTLANRGSELLTQHIDLLRQAYARAKQLHPFKTIAICILPDHLHVIWELPPDDARFDLRWRIIKGNFSRHFESNTERSTSKTQKREKGRVLGSRILHVLVKT